MLLALLAGCQTLGYYAHVTRGQASLLAHRRSIDRVVADPSTPEALRARLRTAQAARTFASDRLRLPRNRSYTYYVQLDRPWVAWNVFATPELSLQPVTHCFPFAGCVSYRGYFRHDLAQREADRQQALGRDVWVGEVPAYSTLGWFADPLLSSMLGWDDDDLVGTIFHELAHQAVYVKDDSAFNESYASFVEQEGLRQWHDERHLAPPDVQGDRLARAFTQQVLAWRDQLGQVYALPLSDDAKRVAKAEAFEVFRGQYLAWRASEAGGDRRYDRWMAQPMNNARLVPFGLYDQWTPAFAQLFRTQGAQWPRFFAAVRRLAALPPTQRTDALRQLAAGGAPTS
jgi:predicted aminopeptidase